MMSHETSVNSTGYLRQTGVWFPGHGVDIEVQRVLEDLLYPMSNKGSLKRTVTMRPSAMKARLSDLLNLYSGSFPEPGGWSFQWAEFGRNPKEMCDAASV